MLRYSPTLLLAAVALVSAPAISQTFASQHTAGFGTVKRFYNASVLPTTPDYLQNGVAIVNGDAYLGTTAAGGSVLVVRNGKLQRSFATPMNPTGGFLDMDTDGSVIFAASSVGIVVFDTKGNTKNLQIKTKNGLKALPKNPIPSVVASVHAVAYNPDGDNGNGSLYLAAQSATPIEEVKLDGTKIKTFANAGWIGSGLTRDPRTGNLWCMHSSTGTQNSGSQDIIELDINNNLKPTGKRFMQGNPATQWNIRCCGGLCGIPGGDVHSYKSDFDIAVQNRLPGDDYIFIHRIHLHPGVLGYNEASLDGGINTTTLTKGGVGGYLGPLKAGDTLSWQTNPANSGHKGKLAVTLLNVGPDAARTGSLSLIPELRVLGPFTTPSSPVMVELYGLLGGPAINVKIPANVLNCFHRVRLQTVYHDPKALPFQLMATNEIWTNVSLEKSCGIIVEAVGANSLNANTASGFFRVIHQGGLPITKVEFDWMACRDSNQTDMVFDCDNPNMADAFWFGNSTQTGATGTYRNNSDKTTGLIYDNLNTPVGPGASTGANTGWIGSNAVNNGVPAYNFKTLTFRFGLTTFQGSQAKPEVFEVDIDTDGGIGTNGASMAGMVVRITVLGGKTYVGELVVDTSSTTSRSVTGF